MARTGTPIGWEVRPCLGTDWALWFGPEDDEPEEPADQAWRERMAKGVCAGCPVLESCLAWELAWPAADQWGVRGGLTAEERAVLIRRHRADGRVA